MKKITKYLIGTGVGLAVLTVSYFTGKQRGFNQGYNLGKQDIIEKLDKVSNIGVENCEHDIKTYRTAKWFSNEDEVKRLENLSKTALDKENTVKDIVRTIKNDKITIE